MKGNMLSAIIEQFVPKKISLLWVNYGIESLALIHLVLQVILTFNGRRRRNTTGAMLRLLVWVAYLLVPKVAVVILGKLMTIDVGYMERNTQTEIQALLAPLTLMQLGSADTITAYSIEDNQLGVRHVFSMVTHVVIMFYIIVRSWTDFKTSLLYIPMCLAGIIKYGETSWALMSTHYSNLGFTFADFLQYDKAINLYKLQEDEKKLVEELPIRLYKLPEGDNKLSEEQLILRAYHRFCWLKPHLENWLPGVRSERDVSKLSIEDYDYEKVFKITDCELGFMYDVLYTKARIVYTRVGLVLRCISFISLITTLCGFSVLFKDAFVYNISAGMINFVLITCVILEIYQILKLPFSDWAILQMIRYHKKFRILPRLLRRLANKSATWRRWSNKIGQFNLVDFSWDPKNRKFGRCEILRYWSLDMKIRKLLNFKQIEVHSKVKELVVMELKVLEKKMKEERNFSKRGEWTIQRYKNEFGNNEEARNKLTEPLTTTITKRPFDKNIVIWFITTNIFKSKCKDCDTTEASQMNAIMELSNYMLFLLALRSQLLSTTTADILFEYSCRMLKILSADKKDNSSDLLGLIKNHTTDEKYTPRDDEKKVIGEWNVLKDVKELAESLLPLDDKIRWNLIGSMWVEMLGYAATNCEMEYHSVNIREGGELITHVWLIIAHTLAESKASHLGAPDVESSL